MSSLVEAMKRRWLWFLPVVGAAGVAGGVALAAAGGLDGGATSDSRTPERLTTEQCGAAGSMLRVASRTLPEFLKQQGQADAIDAFQEEQAEAERWVAAGCPEDAIRGFYPVAGTSGGEIKLYESDWFTMPATGTPAIQWGN